jgi:hypothetical protein
MRIYCILIWLLITLLIMLSAISNEHIISELTYKNQSLKAQVSFLLNDSK